MKLASSFLMLGGPTPTNRRSLPPTEEACDVYRIISVKYTFFFFTWYPHVPLLNVLLITNPFIISDQKNYRNFHNNTKFDKSITMKPFSVATFRISQKISVLWVKFIKTHADPKLFRRIKLLSNMS